MEKENKIGTNPLANLIGASIYTLTPAMVTHTTKVTDIEIEADLETGDVVYCINHCNIIFSGTIEITYGRNGILKYYSSVNSLFDDQAPVFLDKKSVAKAIDSGIYPALLNLVISRALAHNVKQKVQFHFFNRIMEGIIYRIYILDGIITYDIKTLTDGDIGNIDITMVIEKEYSNDN